MKRLTLLVLFLGTVLNADCENLLLLGLQNKTLKSIQSDNTIIWSLRDKKWHASEPLASKTLQDIKCDKNAYALVNENALKNTSKLHPKDSYELTKGWNRLTSPKNGIDTVETFSELKEVKFVYVYDKLSAAWAGFSADDKILQEIRNTRILDLKYIEPNISFYVYVSKRVKVNIENTDVSKICKDKIASGFETLLSSGINENLIFNKEKSVGLKSRYMSHYRRGVYSDSRVLLIYPKIRAASKKLLKYGPGSPRVILNYAKEYEDREFYVFDYFEKSCYKGKYPSMKMPPVPTLRKLKEE
ncbi:hypothetical protein GJV85_00255 [Sulfurimonas aquatica]|uniref:Uncharacterized protein n=1 Tax=Sulfurimonas aquatica TaxID=2672570 RepID=A0A975GBV1_9BACT|nr:hypothetical protein [Sulfurimonas aquatica]QSZ40613.1 hypothetical protein GJV85_00255 [Sulfurimonas aquatica]